MSEKGKGSLLLPLGIGAGLLLLLTSMKKKQEGPVTATAADDAAAIPEIASEEASVPQVDPAPAPPYAAKTEDSGEGQQDDEEEEQEDDTEEDSVTPAAAKSSGGGYTPYKPSSSINTNRSPTPAPAYQTARNIQIIPQAISAKNLRFLSNQARFTVNPKSLRFQSDKKAREFAPRQQVNPLFIGNGKPRMGVPLPVTLRPGATAMVPQPIVSSSGQVIPPAVPAIPNPVTIFPLKFGTTSPYVKEVQRRLGVSATGYFGTLTRAAIQRRFRVPEISEALYKQIITGKIAAAARSIRKPVPKILRSTKKVLPKPYNFLKR